MQSVLAMEIHPACVLCANNNQFVDRRMNIPNLQERENFSNPSLNQTKFAASVAVVASKETGAPRMKSGGIGSANSLNTTNDAITSGIFFITRSVYMH